MILAIDPGPTQSAYVLFDNGTPRIAGIVANDELLQIVRTHGDLPLAVEMIACYGMAVGAEVFETCVWVGRFIEAHGGSHRKVFRREVKMHLCANPKAADSNIRQALVDRYGGKDRAIGKKAARGPLYGFKEDMWAALGVAFTAAETMPAPTFATSPEGRSSLLSSTPATG